MWPRSKRPVGPSVPGAPSTRDVGARVVSPRVPKGRNLSARMPSPRVLIACALIAGGLSDGELRAQDATRTGDGATETVEVRGRVVFAGGMAPVEGAAVVAADSASGRVAHAVTGRRGGFRIFLPVQGDASPVVAVGAAAEGFGRAGPVRLRSSADLRDVTLVLRGDGSVLFPELDGGRASFELSALTGGERLVVGTVREDGTMRPVGSALVTLTDPESGRRVATTSDGAGRFRIDPPTWEGTVRIEVEALGYAQAPAGEIDLQGDPVFVSAMLRAEAVDLPGLEVTVSATEPVLERWGVLDRAGRGFGELFMGERLERAADAAMGRASAVFWRIPGMAVRRGEPAFLRGTRLGTLGCERPDLFVNGALARSGMPSLVEITFDDAVGIHPQNLLAIEVYPTAATVPGDFKHQASDCGAILIWTR